MSDFLVVAFGGNAILSSGQVGTLEEQRANVRRMSEQLGQLILDGHKVVVTHGNGPQVGELMLKSELSRAIVPPISLDVGGAMTQGQIGYMLQQEIGNFLNRRRFAANVCSIVTQVVVDAGDPAFSNPTKPIGRFYSEDEAAALANERGWTMVEDAGRGYRRVVPSPVPTTIVEWPAVRALVEMGTLVIAAGGGGIPVVLHEGVLQGVEAVIDKDLSAWRLAALVQAHTLVLLTEVDQVAINFGLPDEKPLLHVSLLDMKRYYRAGQFPPGSMGPKVSAAIGFLEQGGQRVIITSTKSLVSAVSTGKAGTQIMRSIPVEESSQATAAGVPL